MLTPALQKRVTPSAAVEEIDHGWRFRLPAGDARQYSLAQLDDYATLPRRKFSHRPPLKLSLRARASRADLPGTWGFGFWNDPFEFSLGFGGNARRLPTLPHAAWFFFASNHSHLTLDDTQPGTGVLASVYRSARIPGLALAPAAVAAPVFLWPAASRAMRRIARRFVTSELVQLSLDPTAWHDYEVAWHEDQVQFSVDGQPVLTTTLLPRPPLGLVLWLDNQFAAWSPTGKAGLGNLATPPGCWVELTHIQLSTH